MNVCKLFLALALFTTSVSFEEQVLASKNGLSSNWEISITASQSFAEMAAFEMY